MKLRTPLIVLLILIGALLVVPGSIGVWQEREIMDEDAFVGTVDDVFEQEEVQTALASRLTTVAMEQLEIQQRIADGLANVEERGGERTPEGLALLEGPLTNVAEDAIYRVALRLLEEQPLEEVRDAALRAMHRTVVALVEDDFQFLETSGDDIVLDLGAILEAIITDVAGDRAENFLANADIPEDAGQIVLTEKTDFSFVWDLVDWLRTYYPAMLGVAVALFAVAIAISGSRRLTVIWVGGAVAVLAATQVLAIAQARTFLVDLAAEPEGKDAAGAAYDVLVGSFKRQQGLLILIGLGLVAGGALGGEPAVQRAVMSPFRRRPAGAEEAAGLGEWLREKTPALRIAGLGLGAMFLIVWPDPSTRLIVTVLALLAAYLVVLTAATSDAAWAVWVRAQTGSVWKRYFTVDPAATGGPGLAGWIAAKAPWLRMAGLLVGVVVLIALPDVRLGYLLVVLALEMLYFAAIELAAGRAFGGGREPRRESD